MPNAVKGAPGQACYCLPFFCFCAPDWTDDRVSSGLAAKQRVAAPPTSKRKRRRSHTWPQRRRSAFRSWRKEKDPDQSRRDQWLGQGKSTGTPRKSTDGVPARPIRAKPCRPSCFARPKACFCAPWHFAATAECTRRAAEMLVAGRRARGKTGVLVPVPPPA